MSSPTPEVSDAPRSAVSDLERELRAQGAARWWKRLAIVVVLGGVGFGYVKYRERTKPPPESRFVVAEVTQRDVVEQVQSTGKLKPLKEVQIGAQVSGRVVNVHVDFNSHVEKGALLAEIDPSLFGAQVSQVRGQLTAAEAGILRARAARDANQVKLSRLQTLRAGDVATEAEVETAQGAVDVSMAEVVAAEAQLGGLRAQLNSASTTLGYTKIYSPIAGVVVSRSVDPGQTVAASFASPVLFVIAQDLKEMQVLADIDEADVGKLKEGLPAEVVVDAFPGETFGGKVTQLRYSPTEVQGVVTYAAVIDVKNPELKLRPGMTATVSVTTREARGVVAVPNAALRFRPKPDKDGKGESAPAMGSTTAPAGSSATGAPVAGAATATSTREKLTHGKGRIYFREGNAPTESTRDGVVELGITDGVFTEVKVGLAAGTSVITSERAAEGRPKFLGMF
jgi:HlyD family secretion protein